MANQTPPLAPDMRIVEIYRAGDVVEAHAVANLLRAHDIDVRVVGEVIETIQGSVPFGRSSAPRLWTNREQATQAKATIAAWQATRANHAPVASFPFGLRTLFVNLILIAAVFALHRITQPEPDEQFFNIAFYFIIFGNLLVMAYRRRQRQTCDDDPADDELADEDVDTGDTR